MKRPTRSVYLDRIEAFSKAAEECLKIVTELRRLPVPLTEAQLIELRDAEADHRRHIRDVELCELRLAEERAAQAGGDG